MKNRVMLAVAVAVLWTAGSVKAATVDQIIATKVFAAGGTAVLDFGDKDVSKVFDDPGITGVGVGVLSVGDIVKGVFQIDNIKAAGEAVGTTLGGANSELFGYYELVVASVTSSGIHNDVVYAARPSFEAIFGTGALIAIYEDKSPVPAFVDFSALAPLGVAADTTLLPTGTFAISDVGTSLWGVLGLAANGLPGVVAGTFAHDIKTAYLSLPAAGAASTATALTLGSTVALNRVLLPSNPLAAYIVIPEASTSTEFTGGVDLYGNSGSGSTPGFSLTSQATLITTMQVLPTPAVAFGVLALLPGVMVIRRRTGRTA